MLESIRRMILNRIEEKGRAEGAPIVNFPERTISVEGEDIYVGQGWVEWFLLVSGFYLALPPNTYGVVVYPDGKVRKLPGGMYEAPAGVYRIHYVDNHERTDVSEPVSELTTDGEKLTLKIIVRYRVIEPILALEIANPVETMMVHIETDVAQYIRTHDHSDIADSSEKGGRKIFNFFSERHNSRVPLSKAISILGVELKEFAGDKEYVEMRRQVRKDERQIQAGKRLEELQQEFDQLKAMNKAENERLAAEHVAKLAKAEAEHKAEKEKIEANHEKAMQDILHDVNLRKIKLDNKGKHLQRREEEFLKAIDAISKSFSSGYPTNPNVIKTMTDLVAALKEGVDSDDAEENMSETSNRPTKPRVSPEPTDKVEKLTNTLLNLLDPKK
ncbi:MAG: hypothetical protein HY865_26220 [Chloroflexi bacterium]|nr:hypothetical protein [Chloroflexota bacterium]